MDFRRRRPSAEALAWVERELGVRVAGFRRMTGGIIAAVHRLTVEYVPSGRREFVVLRQYEHHGAVDREAAVLRQAADAGLPTPQTCPSTPPNIGHNIRRAVDEITTANGLTNQVTHLVYSHHHADHQGASSLFGGDIVRIGHGETRRLLLRDDDPARPVPDVTFTDSYTLEVGGERVELAWHGPNHSPDNIYIHFPGHDTLMFIDVVNAGWIPIYNLSLSDDVIGYSGAPAIALDYPWTHLISGHLGRVATREDVAMHQQYIADIEASSREAPTSRSSPGPRRSRSCSRSASTAAPAARSIPERNGSLRIRT